ncbi:sialate O-acetylesterase [Echeneis naucrates]|uniref:Sialate O-acetylesterase domain-containing protein n=1 Tax=Echeneis naucrates TaxID=173247 RepID=A0A665UM91_ECHNA|nr:sialate O-acetylesterase [Echeneis naucrates]
MDFSERSFQLFSNAVYVLIMAATLFSVLLLLSSIHSSGGELRFASYYGDHQVLQKSPQRAVLWGFGPEGAQVTVSLSGPEKQKTSPVTVTEGVWRVSLEPVQAGGPYSVKAASESSTATLTDVFFGDVWLCGGQSNMYFKTSQIFNASEELALAARYPYVRAFMAALNMSDIELSDLIQVELPWTVPTASSVAEFSAVCWLFGRYMYDILQYPIGLVESCWGGTPVEAWSSSRALQQCGLDRSTESPSPKDRNSVLWNAMIHPLLNMTIKGAIWYQGETNAVYHQNEYNCSFPAMIDDWRMTFNEGSGGQTAINFPFGFVQLSTYQKHSTDDSFPNIRWHQTADTGFVPNPRMQQTFMAVALDLPDLTSPYGTIHPRDKQDVAYRLALGARAVAYGEKDVAFQGPFPEEILTGKTFVNITYSQTVSVTQSKDAFEICCSEIQAPCGSQSQWVPAPIMQCGPTTVQLSTSLCPVTDEVVAVRYAWRDWPCAFKACPVYSASGILPAPPFISNCYQEKRKIWKRN